MVDRRAHSAGSIVTAVAGARESPGSGGGACRSNSGTSIGSKSAVVYGGAGVPSSVVSTVAGASEGSVSSGSAGRPNS